MKETKEKILTDGRIACLLVVILLIIDQIIKITVKTHMCLGESIRITDWFFINFIENNGMAFGMTFFKLYSTTSKSLIINTCTRESRFA